MTLMRSCIPCIVPLALALTGVAAAAGDNQLTLHVTGGPHAGAYQAAASETLCFKDLFTAAWIHFTADSNPLADAGVEISHPETPGPKHGTVRLRFGKDGLYELLNPPLTLTPTAHGKTTAGIGITLEAVCEDEERH